MTPSRMCCGAVWRVRSSVPGTDTDRFLENTVPKWDVQDEGMM